MDKKVLLILGVIILFGLFLRLNHLFDKELGTDEKLTINEANDFKDLSSVIEKSKNLRNEVNPTLFPIILSLPLLIYDSTVSMKLFVVLIGLISVIIFYLFSRKFLNERNSLLATLIYSFSPMHIILSQHLRSYILLLLLFNLLLYFLYKFLFENDEKSIWVIALISVVSLYVHYYASLFILGAVVTCFVFYYFDRKIKIMKYIYTNFIVFILSIPSFLLLKAQYTHLYVDLKPLITLKVVPYPLYKLAAMVDLSTALKNFSYIIILFPITFLLFFYALYKFYKNSKKKELLFLSCNFFVPYVILSIAGFILPVHSFRYLMYLLPLYVFTFSYGLFSIENKLFRYLLLFLVIILWAIIITYYFSIVTTYHWNINIAL